MDHDVDNVVVTCALRQFTIGGTINNLQGSGMRITNNGTDELRPTGQRPVHVPDGADHRLAL